MRTLLRLILLLGLLALLSTTAYADGTAVTAMETECVVESDGACTVTMKITADFAPGTEGFAIPVSPAAREITCSEPYTAAEGDGCRLLVLNGVLSGTAELTVSYRLTETVTDDGSAQEFFIRLLYPAWTCPISGYRVVVRLPGSFESMPVFLSGYYGDRIDNYMEIRIDRGVIDAVLNPKQTLQDHEAMSMQLQLPEGFFDLRFLAGKTVRTDRLLFLGFLALAILFWLIFLRNVPILPKRQAMPPEGGNAGEIPYVLTGRSPDLALMVVQWASLGYLTVTRSRRGRIWLTRQIEMDNERKPFEVEIFRTLFARGDHCDVRSAEFLKARRVAPDQTRSFWQDRIYETGPGASVLLRLLVLAAGMALCLACADLLIPSKSWRWYAAAPLTLAGGAACLAVQQLGGFLLRRRSLGTAFLALLGAAFLLALGYRSGMLLFAGLNLAVQLGVGLLLRCGGRRTEEGAALASELLGYRRYLLSSPAELFRNNLEADPQYFYRVLPYADALRVGKPFAVSFEGAKLEDCDWLIWEGRVPRTAPGFYARYRRLMAGLRNERDPGPKPRSAKRAKAQVSTRVTPPARSRSRRNGGCR